MGGHPVATPNTNVVDVVVCFGHINFVSHLFVMSAVCPPQPMRWATSITEMPSITSFSHRPPSSSVTTSPPSSPSVSCFLGRNQGLTLPPSHGLDTFPQRATPMFPLILALCLLAYAQLSTTISEWLRAVCTASTPPLPLRPLAGVQSRQDGCAVQVQLLLWRDGDYEETATAGGPAPVGSPTPSSHRSLSPPSTAEGLSPTDSTSHLAPTHHLSVSYLMDNEMCWNGILDLHRTAGETGAVWYTDGQEMTDSGLVVLEEVES